MLKIYPRAIFPVHRIRMALDDRTAQQHLTPEERREMLRAFADRMLLKVSAMDDPEDMPGVEKAMRVAAVIERVYSRCDRAERQIRDKTIDPNKLEAECATHETDAFEAARAELVMKKRAAAQPVQVPIPPLRGPPPRSG